MSGLGVLVDEYPGDEVWAKFATVWGATDFEIENVARAMMGGDAERWFRSSVPALNNRAPAEVVASEPQGRTAIRTLLMRMP